MPTSVRVLSYNTQLRSWTMEAGDQVLILPTTSVEERAGSIADRILASPSDYDILCFMEVFDEDGLAVLIDKLRAKYPHIIEKCDDGGVRFACASLSTIGPIANSFASRSWIVKLPLWLLPSLECAVATTLSDGVLSKLSVAPWATLTTPAAPTVNRASFSE